MKRWYPDRIGGMFTANAEAVADRALEEPMFDPVEFNAERLAQKSHFKPNLRLWLPQGDLLGWKKHTGPYDCGTEVMVGTLATLLGAAAAPVVALDERSVFSPACLELPVMLEGFEEFAAFDPMMIGAVGQFRYWVNDVDGPHNMAKCPQSSAGYIFDYEAVEPWRELTAFGSEQFIEVSLAMQQGEGRLAYKSAAAEMARRISAVSDAQIIDVAKTIRDAGIHVHKDMEAGLIRRRALLKRPVYPQSIFDWCAPKFG